MIESMESTHQKVIVFSLNNKEYCIPTEHVIAIEKMHHITRVPNTAEYIKGVINLRGVIIPIIDLKKRIHIADSEITENTRIIITSHQDIQVGMIVDEANDVLDIPVDLIEPSANIIGKGDEEFISGVVN